MIHAIDAAEFFELRKKYPVFDVRSPGEHSQGHMPRSINLPLFDDEERRKVGTLYKVSGRQAAILEGLGFVGAKLQELVKKARRFSSGNTLMVHCWRGGMRSESVAWLFSTAGFEVYLLKGGYKAYRRYIREQWERDCKLMVVAGKTGSGKTDIIHQLAALGQQVLDLEKAAHHKGSAFGAFGEQAQPTNEQFENNLSDLWHDLDAALPIWLEDESRFIGKLSIPEALYQKKQKSTTFCIDVPRNLRIERLVKEYACYPKEMIIDAITRITHRLGGQHAKAAIGAVADNHFEVAVDIVLTYYDKTYAFDLQLKPDVRVLTCTTSDADTIAQMILQHSLQQI
jgi:tRNA 2-selenouridine synthase